MPDRRLTFADVRRSPASFLALGFGTGLAPVAPGTFGTLPGLLACLLCGRFSLPVYLAIVAVAFVAGIWICSTTSRTLGVHDHGGIVWDEIVGMLVTMIAIPNSIGTLAAGFVLFRVFDIFKPWPIRWIDKEVHGGTGIMLDDMFAGIMACACMHLLMGVFPQIAHIGLL